MFIKEIFMFIMFKFIMFIFVFIIENDNKIEN